MHCNSLKDAKQKQEIMCGMAVRDLRQAARDLLNAGGFQELVEELGIDAARKVAGRTNYGDVG